MTTAAGVALSTQADTAAAAREAAAGALARAGGGRVDWGVVFATVSHRPHFAAMLAEVQATLGTDLISGCSAWGVLTGSEEVEGRPAIAVLAVRSSRLAAQTFYIPAGDSQELGVAREIARQIGPPLEEGLLALWPDPFTVRPDELVRAFGRVLPGVEAVGAAASADPSGDRTFLFHGRNVAAGGLAALRLSGSLRRTVGITQGCQPLGDPCRVTKGDGNVILELDGRPALEVLRQRLPPSLRDSLDRLGAHLFVGLPPDPDQERIEPGEYLVRTLIGGDSQRGAVVVGGAVREGEPVLLVLREGQAAREDLKQMLARLGRAAAATPYHFGLYFNCAARGTGLYGLPGIDTAYISGTFDDLPIIGFFGNAEIAPLRGVNRLFTYTGVLVLIGEEKEGPGA